MLPNYAPWRGLEAYQRGVVPLTKCCWCKLKNNVETIWKVSMHYLINAQVENCGLLPNYVPWYGPEAYQTGVSVTSYFYENGKQLRNYLYGRSKPYIYH